MLELKVTCHMTFSLDLEKILSNYHGKSDKMTEQLCKELDLHVAVNVGFSLHDFFELLLPELNKLLEFLPIRTDHSF